MNTNLRDRLARCSDLPSLPRVAMQVLEICQSEDPNLADIARVLGTDPALSAKILRLSNSSIYGLKQEVRTISHAVNLLGLNAVRTLALSFSLLRDVHKRDQQGLASFWKRSIFAAVAARELAVAVNFAYGEEAFLAGLLQDIGILALRQVDKTGYAALEVDDDHRALASREQASYGSDHTEVGGWLAGRWRLPASLSVAVAASHKPDDLPPDSPAQIVQLARLVAVSGAVADIWVRRDLMSASATAHREAERLLALPPDRMKDLLGRLGVSVAEASSLFDVDVGSAEEIAAILDQAKEALVVSALRTSRDADSVEARSKDIEEEAQRDGLTGLANRAHFEKVLAREFASCSRSNRPLSLIMIDIDHFKVVNDTWGHPVGDKVLAAIAAVMRQRLRPRDLLARYGGEEFVLVLPETDVVGAKVVAERVRSQTEAALHSVGAPAPLRITISAGLATSVDGSYGSKESLVDAADRALYAAKRAGRNRLVTAATCTSTTANLPAMPAA